MGDGEGNAVEERYQYRADLEETALPEILHTIATHRVPGVMTAENENVVKHVYVDGGAVIFASSSDRGDSLGEYLLRTEQIDRGEFETAMEERESSDRRLGEVLIDRGTHSPAEMHLAIQEQIRAIVWTLFSWRRGSVRFRVGPFEDDEMVRIHIPLPQVILEGVREMPDAKDLVGRLGRRQTVFEPSWRTEQLIEAAVKRQEMELLRMVDGERTLYDLCTTGPYSAGENARLLYAFHILQLIERGTERHGTGRVTIRYPSGSTE